MSVLPKGEIVLGINCPLGLGSVAEEAYAQYQTTKEEAMAEAAARLTLYLKIS